MSLSSGEPKLILLVLAIPVLYVLSIGPAVPLLEATSNDRVAEAVFETVYSPVIWLHGHTFLKQPLETYAALWGWH